MRLLLPLTALLLASCRLLTPQGDAYHPTLDFNASANPQTVTAGAGTAPATLSVKLIGLSALALNDPAHCKPSAAQIICTYNLNAGGMVQLFTRNVRTVHVDGTRPSGATFVLDK